MIRRTHTDGAIRSTALYSDCEGYRYRLARRWDHGPELLFIMLNPSTATETRNDPTIERCQRRAMQLGYGALCIANLFAWRETSPAALKQASAPVGADNDAILSEAATQAAGVIAGWGVHGAHLGRGAEVRGLLADLPLSHLGLTKHGHPRHPLYVPYSTRPQSWSLP